MTIESHVQVQIVTFNSAATLEACLASVVRQTHKRISLLIIDNASMDESLSIAERYCDHARVIRNRENSGYAAAHNQGFDVAIQDDVEAVLTLNPDVELADDYVSACLSVLRQNDGVAGVTGKIVDASKPGTLDTTGIVINRWFHAKDRGYGEIDVGQYDGQQYVSGVCGAAAIYSIESLRDFKEWRGYILDESFISYKEDVELSLVAQLRKWSFSYECKAQAIHHRGWKPGTKSAGLLRVQSQLNQFSLLWTFHDRNLMYIFLNLGEFARCAILAIETGAYRRVFSSLHRVHTRAIQKRRAISLQKEMPR